MLLIRNMNYLTNGHFKEINMKTFIEFLEDVEPFDGMLDNFEGIHDDGEAKQRQRDTEKLQRDIEAKQKEKIRIQDDNENQKKSNSDSSSDKILQNMQKIQDLNQDILDLTKKKKDV